jgi:hypothetical protein
MFVKIIFIFFNKIRLLGTIFFYKTAGDNFFLELKKKFSHRFKNSKKKFSLFKSKKKYFPFLLNHDPQE